MSDDEAETLSGDFKETFNIVVVGAGGVGKSAVTLNFMRHQFVEDYDPTIEDSYTKVIEVDGIKCNLEITDTAGQEEYRGLWGDKFMRNGEGFLLVYAITDQSSFEEVGPLRTQIVRVKDSEKVPTVIIGNKCDLKDDRLISEAEGKELCAKSGANAFLETSAKKDINIENAFHELVRAIRQYRLTEGITMEGQNAASGNDSANKVEKGGCCVIS